jgi:hypothetical protein
MRQHIASLVELFLHDGTYFSIMANVAEIEHTPPLPKYITDSFNPISLFVLENYTYETISIDNNYISFEAGFGEENIGAVITIPLSHIVQILVDDIPVFINMSTHHDRVDLSVEEQYEKSKSKLLSNPKNRKLLNDS